MDWLQEIGKLKVLAFIVVFIMPVVCGASSASFFDEKMLYSEPLANPRTPDTGITVKKSRYLGQNVGYIDANLGKSIPIVTIDTIKIRGDTLQLQTGISAGFWATLGYNEGAFPLLTQDFLISIPIEFKWGNFSGAIKWNHISAHLGDGLEGLLEDNLSDRERRELEIAEEILEEFTGNEEAGIVLKEAFSYSRDFMSIHVAYESKMGIFDHRSYSHVGYAHKMFPNDLKRWFFGGGVEVVYPSEVFAPYFATDITYNQDTDSVDLSSELGAIIMSGKTKHHIFRIAFMSFIGYDRRGQLIGRKMKELGFGFTIQ